MGLISKISEARMKDPAEGTLRVVGITMPDPTATSCNYRMDGVVQADGLLPTAVTHHGMCSTSRWPSPGEELPVTVDRAKPERLVVHWKELPTGAESAVSMAQQLAAQMRAGGPTTAAAGLAGLTTLPSALGGGIPGGVSLAGMAGAATPAVPTVSNDDILARGLAGTATLLSTFQSPVAVTKPGRVGIGLMLNVMIAGRQPYPIQNVYALPNEKVGKLVPGATLPVKVDQTMANLVAVDWNNLN